MAHSVEPVAMATVAAPSYSYMEGTMGLKVCLDVFPYDAGMQW